MADKPAATKAWEWLSKGFQSAKLIDVLNFVGIGATLVGVWFAYLALDEQRLGTAWNLVATGKDERGVGNTGLINALKVLKEHNQTLYQVRLPGAFLSGIALPGFHLEKSVLTKADLSHATLNSAQLGGADLTGANLHMADLGDADLRGATLDGADLSGASLDHADLRGASMRGARLFTADLRHALLQEADLSYADLNATDLTGAILDGATLDETKMRGADLERANFGRAIITKIDLRRADLRGAFFDNLDMKQVRIQKPCEIDKSDSGWCGPPRPAYRDLPFPEANLDLDPMLAAYFSPSFLPGRRAYYLIPTLVDEWQTESQKVIEHLFNARGFQVISLNADGDAALQNRQLAQVAAADPDVIILNAVDIARIDRNLITKARQAGARVLVYDRQIPDVAVDFTSITDAFETGKLAATTAVQLLNDQSNSVGEATSGRIMEILGDPGDSWSSNIRLGFDDTIRAKLPKIHIVPVPAMNWDPDDAYQRITHLIADKNDPNKIDAGLKLIFAHAAELSVAALRALQEKKTDGQILLMSSNGAPDGLDNIRNGRQQVEIDEPVYAQAYVMALFFDEIVHGEPLTARSCEILSFRGKLAMDPKHGPTFTLSGTPINSDNIRDPKANPDPKFWGNLIPPNQDPKVPCRQ